MSTLTRVLVPVCIVTLLSSAVTLVQPAAIQEPPWQGGGPTGTAVTVIRSAPNSPHVVYLGTSGTGVFRSANRGATWSGTDPSFVGTEVVDIAVHPADANIALAATSIDGLYRTSTGGTTWTRVSTGLPAATVVQVTSLAFDPADGNRAYVCLAPARAHEDFFGSTDAGISWFPLPSDEARHIGTGTPGRVRFEEMLAHLAPVLDVLVTEGVPPHRLYLATEAGVRLSMNGGLEWETLTHGLESVVPRLFTQVAAVPRGERRYDMVAGSLRGLFVAREDGRSFEAVPALAAKSIRVLEAPRRGVQHPAIVITHDGQLWRESFDGELDWVQLILPAGSAAPITAGILDAVELGQAVRLLVGLADGTLLASDDSGTSFVAVTGPGAGLSIHAIAIDPQNTQVAFAAAKSQNGHIGRGLWKTVNGGGTWTQLTHPLLSASLVEDIAIDPANSAVVFAAVAADEHTGLRRGIYRSVDGGATWSRVFSTAPVTALDIQPGIVRAGAAQREGTVPMADNLGLHVSTDGGATWTRLQTDFGGGTGTFGSVVDIAADPNAPSSLYLAVYGRTDNVFENGVYLSSDGGLTAQPLPTPFGLTDFFVSEVYLRAGAPGRIIASSSAGLYGSTDGGQNWSRLGVSIPGVEFLAIKPSPRAPSELVAVERDHGVFLSSDDGASWQGLGPSAVGISQDIAVSLGLPMRLYLGTLGQGVFSVTIP